MERIGGENTGMPTSIRKVVAASFIGTTIEWYDYFISLDHIATNLGLFPGRPSATRSRVSLAARWHRSSPQPSTQRGARS
jgi:hypothetical protein